MADSLKLAVGDRVVYPSQGLCKVTGIDTKEIAGQRLQFVSLIREEDGSKLMVPETKAAAIGVRRVSSAEQVKKVFDFLKNDSDKASLDWKARARENVERMATGGLMGLAEVVKGLQVLSELRPLPTKERELYDDARHLLVAELSASMNTLAADAEDAIDAILFPVGKERPKRTAEEFRVTGGGDDELGLDDDLMGLDGELGEEAEPAEAEASEGGATESGATEGDAEGESDGDDGKPKKAAKKAAGAEGDGEAKKKRGRPAKAKAPESSDDADENDTAEEEALAAAVKAHAETAPAIAAPAPVAAPMAAKKPAEKKAPAAKAKPVAAKAAPKAAPKAKAPAAKAKPASDKKKPAKAAKKK